MPQRFNALIRLLVAILSILILATTATVATATQEPSRFGPRFHPTPEGFSMYITFMGTGLYDPNSPNPEIPNCFQGLCTGTYLFDEILGLDATEQAAYYADALDLWRTRFGIDPEDPEWVGRVVAFPFYVDPRSELRAYSMARTRIHRGGWRVHDGGWILLVTDPEGVELGGDFAGVHVGPNTIFSRGTYVIEARTHSGGFLADVVLQFHSRTPVAFVPGTPVVASCELSGVTINGHPAGWGAGQAQLSSFPETLPSGEIKGSYRNILTFGAGGGLGDPYPTGVPDGLTPVAGAQ